MENLITSFLFAALFAAVAVAEPSASKSNAEGATRFNTDEHGSILLTLPQMQQIVLDEVALRRRFSEPGFYTDVQLTLPEIKSALQRDPFDGRRVNIDRSQPDVQARDTHELYSAYNIYARTSGVRDRIFYLLRMYEARELFGACARVGRAKRFYESDKMKSCLKSLVRFNSVFKQLNTSVRGELKNGGRLGAASVEKLTLDHIFSARTTFSDYVNVFGRIPASFNNPLLVLMRYNERMNDHNLTKFRNGSVQMNQDLSNFFDLRKKAIENARDGRSIAGIAQLIELDERISDCIYLAISEMDIAIKKFQDTGTDYFKLRTGLPCADVFSCVDVESGRDNGPDYPLLVRSAYELLRRDFEKIYREKFQREMSLR